MLDPTLEPNCWARFGDWDRRVSRAFRLRGSRNALPTHGLHGWQCFNQLRRLACDVLLRILAARFVHVAFRINGLIATTRAAAIALP